MTEFEKELIRKLRDHANQEENYEAGWDLIVESYTDPELLALISPSNEATAQKLQEVILDVVIPLPAAPNFAEAKRRAQAMVDLNEERRRAIQNEIW